MGGKIKKGKEKPCERCGTLEGVTFAPDPFQSEIHEDETPHHLCEDCRAASREEI